ncbi:MAG: PDZ domain-containing protein [Armatimonadia bacterium]|nr:PDZ domain-containing protein [Armatimonadia bacterium]
MPVSLRWATVLCNVAVLAWGAGALAQSSVAEGESEDPRAQQDAFTAAIDMVQGSVVGVVVARPADAPNESVDETEVGPGSTAPSVHYVIGAGFVVDAEGWVITSMPLVADAEHVEILTATGTSLPVEAIHYDRTSEVAALRIDPGDEAMPTVAFLPHEEAKVRPGQWAIVVGPVIRGMPIASVGHVTAPYLRVVPSERNDLPSRVLLFTSISRVPMSEGAPLVDLDGRVLGMCLPATEATALDDVGDVMAAVPTREIQSVFERIRSGHAVKRPWMGVHLQDVPAEAAADLGAPDGGIYIVRVDPEGPAAAAGVQVGDVLTGMQPVGDADAETIPVTGLADLSPVLDDSEPGDVYRLTLMREGQPLEADLTLGVFPYTTAEQQMGGDDREFGLTARPATEEELEAFQAEHGLIVEDVAIGEGAYLLGLRAGDLLVRIGETTLHTTDDLQAALDAVGPDDVLNIQFRRIDEGGLGSFLAVGNP